MQRRLLLLFLLLVFSAGGVVTQPSLITLRSHTLIKMTRIAHEFLTAVHPGDISALQHMCRALGLFRKGFLQHHQMFA